MSNKLCSARCFAGTFVVPEEASWWDVQICSGAKDLHQISHKDMATKKQYRLKTAIYSTCMNLSKLHTHRMIKNDLKKKHVNVPIFRALRSSSHDTRRSHFSFSWFLMIFVSFRCVAAFAVACVSRGHGYVDIKGMGRVWGDANVPCACTRVQCYAATQLIIYS